MKYILGIILCIAALPLSAQEAVLSKMGNDANAQSMNIVYTWDDFLAGKSCFEDFYRLQNLPFLSQKQQLLKDKMQIYCLGKTDNWGQLENSSWENLLNTFRQNKRTLLLNKKLKENGKILGYIKAVPYLLFDVYRKHPQTETLHDKLDHIQEAIYHKDPDQILKRMQLLLPYDQIFLTSVFNEAHALLDFKEALEEGGNP